jgi:hypothetical protein
VLRQLGGVGFGVHLVGEAVDEAPRVGHPWRQDEDVTPFDQDRHTEFSTAGRWPWRGQAVTHDAPA